jgi:hypothetical protein
MPTARAFFVTVVVNGLIYVIGGYKSGSGYLSSVVVYDPIEDSWSNRPSMPTAREYATGVAFENMIYVIGGEMPSSNPYQSGEITNVVEVYNTTTESWATLSPMPTPREGICSAVVGGKIHVFGGTTSNSTALLDTHEVYDIATDSWSTGSPLPTPESDGTCIAVGSKIYVLGGVSGVGAYSAVQVFDTINEVWDTGKPIPIGRAGAGAASIDQSIFLIGGYGTSQSLTANERLDTTSGIWSDNTPMPIGRSGLGVAFVEGEIYAIGGRDPNSNAYLTTNEMYTPPITTSQWKGSYISTYYSELPWHPKIAEIHISAQDALASGTTAYVLVVEKLASGGEQIAGKIPTGGALLQTIFKAIGEAVSGNPDGSYDFTAMEIAGGVGWFYGGSFSKGTILPVAISYWPIPIPLFSLPTPCQFNLIYSDVPNANLIQNAISAGQTIISLSDPNSKLYLMVQDNSGRRAGVDALLNETIIEIPSSIYAEYKSNMAVVLPINVTSFTCMVDGRKASQQNENYTLTVETVVNGDIASSKNFTSQINKGQVANYTVQISNGMIETVPPTTPFVYLVYLVPVVILVVAISLFVLRRKRKKVQTNRIEVAKKPSVANVQSLSQEEHKIISWKGTRQSFTYY